VTKAVACHFLDIALEVEIGKTGFRFCNSSNRQLLDFDAV